MTSNYSLFAFHYSLIKAMVLQKIEALRKELNEHNYNYYVLDTPSPSL